ncbi:PhaM family polyhydroxyalkanoate granule multifunctional regulatory protein [Ramlibacter tataouinensis]|uniref:Alginate biosynthesis protein AlgP n=1 Tax=Ramlibacter tataouinensis (strain ATCC BAA-407 / DSM 14655 / LMG 21543 / TTB310) TaxID=365046 RepID=F5Y1H1_RAMTT|nr:PhaM family polyhydroxyalkanoate granule multifunctional regulatory protein [Ramlibacter tataouinensis]AEG94755.1 Conserved hypothetical protein [Ramlibacter tataouinensis TTB310]
MSDSNNAFGFGKLVPGFDFLQNLAKGAGSSMPQMPNLSSWVAPTLNVEELDKRLQELRAVHFWLDQNTKALSATIQALEVQKMTLATLQGMNVSMGEVANALKLKAADALGTGRAQPATDTGEASGGKPAGAIDPLQWWGALTQQFQQIAANAMQDAAQKGADFAARSPAAGVDPAAAKTAGEGGGAAPADAPAKAPAKKKPARKTAAR